MINRLCRFTRLSAVFQNVGPTQNFTVRENATTELLLTSPPEADASRLDWVETGFLSAGGAAIAAGIGFGILAVQAQQDLDDCRVQSVEVHLELDIANDLRSGHSSPIFCSVVAQFSVRWVLTSGLRTQTNQLSHLRRRRKLPDVFGDRQSNDSNA